MCVANRNESVKNPDVKGATSGYVDRTPSFIINNMFVLSVIAMAADISYV